MHCPFHIWLPRCMDIWHFCDPSLVAIVISGLQLWSCSHCTESSAEKVAKERRAHETESRERV
jgi:hypothetical protein